MNPSAVVDPSDTLDRHEQRRASGLPTVSVLAGPVGLGMGEARRWAEARGMTVVSVQDDRVETMARGWVRRLADERDLHRDAVAWLARRIGQPAAELGPRIARKTAFELREFLAATLPATFDGAALACHPLLERLPIETSPVAANLADRLIEAWPGPDGPASWASIVAAMTDLIAPANGPVVLASQPPETPDAPAWIASAARSLTDLAAAEPRLPLILLVERADLDSYLNCAPDSRAKAILREGIIILEPLDSNGIGRQLAGEQAEPPTRLAATIRRLANDGASAGLVDRLREAASACDMADHSAPDDRARSAAERFLFDRLESLPQTVGLFALNASLDNPSGSSRPLEVDFLARSLRIAVEIDGYYHFQDHDAYRRDRRKDFHLQRLGFWVLRFLADDVVERLEDVLDTIQAAVADRRVPSSGETDVRPA